MDRGFWRGKRVLVTGHTGFKGSWLSLWLQSAGANLMGYSLPSPTDPSLFHTASVETGMHSIVGDIRDLEGFVASAVEFRPEILLHLAAQTVVRASYADPLETFSSNVMGTVNVLEGVRRCPTIRSVVIVTSDKCYENKEWLWPYREYEPLGGHDPYSASKACAEIVTAAYRRSFFAEKATTSARVGIATARAGNVVGGGDWTADQLIPDIIRAFVDSRPVCIRNPLATRPWQFVLEPINGYLMLAERLWDDPVGFSEAWNFGPDEEECKTVEWISDYMVRIWGNGARWELDVKAHPHEARSLRLDSSAAHARLDWHPILHIEEALARAAEWYQTYYSSGDVRALTEAQIRDFESRS